MASQCSRSLTIEALTLIVIMWCGEERASESLYSFIDLLASRLKSLVQFIFENYEIPRPYYVYLHLTTERGKKRTVSITLLPTPGNMYSILEKRKILNMTHHLILSDIFFSYTKPSKFRRQNICFSLPPSFA